MSNQYNRMEEYFGYAICDKDENSRELKVYCPDLLPLHTGDLNAVQAQAHIKNSVYVGNITEANYITCTYRDDTADHEAFPPDIRKGEQVRIFKLADSEQYYWASCGRTEGNRRTETHRIAISDTLENDSVLDDTNSYYLELDTRRSHSITLTTNKADGEAYKYQLKIDADKHQVYLGDDAGNGLLIQSDVPSVTLTNKSGATMQVTDSDMDMTCKGNQNTYIEGSVKQDIEKELYVRCRGNVRIVCDGNVSIKSKGAISLDSRTRIDLTAPSINVSKGGTKWDEE